MDSGSGSGVEEMAARLLAVEAKGDGYLHHYWKPTFFSIKLAQEIDRTMMMSLAWHQSVVAAVDAAAAAAAAAADNDYFEELREAIVEDDGKFSVLATSATK